MKLKTGGGGLDADGNWYEIPTEVIEVSEALFKKALHDLWATNAPGSIPSSPDMIPCSEEALKALKEIIGQKD